MTEYKTITYELKNHVAEVFMNRPAKSNAMNPDFWPEIEGLFKQIHDDREVRVVIIGGNGKNFSAGLDLMESAGTLESQKGTHETDTLYRTVIRIQQAFNAVDECRKPVIAAVHGACVGGGLDLIAACDIRLCSRDAYFSLREAKLAIIADIGSLNRLPRLIGEGPTRELAFTGKNIDSARAEKIGLVNDVYEDRDALLEAARTLAAEIAETAPLAVQGAKEVMNYCRDKTNRDGLAYAAARSCLILKGNDIMEAVSAYMQKRKPNFEGK